MTSLGGYHNQLHTPHSAVSVHSSYPYPAAPTQTPIQPYNPQEWAPSPAVARNRLPDLENEYYTHFSLFFTRIMF